MINGSFVPEHELCGTYANLEQPATVYSRWLKVTNPQFTRKRSVLKAKKEFEKKENHSSVIVVTNDFPEGAI